MDILYTKTWSTGMLERHIKIYHQQNFREDLRTGEKKAVIGHSTSQAYIDGFAMCCHTVEQCLVNWAVAVYQPLCSCEEETIRNLCWTMNKKSPILSWDKLHTLM